MKRPDMAGNKRASKPPQEKNTRYMPVYVTEVWYTYLDEIRQQEGHKSMNEFARSRLPKPPPEFVAEYLKRVEK